MYLKKLVKDALASARQKMNLPHNKTIAQIEAAQAMFDFPATIQQRITTIAQATHIPEQTITFWLDAFEHLHHNTLADRKKWLAQGGGIMSVRDQKSLYALVRALEPCICVETGVGAGASSVIILNQLNRQSEGRLYSIDLDTPHADQYGELIPTDLRQRWKLKLQPINTPSPGWVDELPVFLWQWLNRCSQAILPILLAELGTIDFFLHDSRHTFRHMAWEYELAWRYIRPGGCLASHDVAATSTFDDFQRAHASEISGMGRIANFGFFIKR